MSTPDDSLTERRVPRSLGGLIFASRWLQVPIYLGLVAAQLVYAIVFVQDVIKLVGVAVITPLSTGRHPDDTAIMLGVLGLVDIAMISNLLIMVIVGGYETFVAKISFRNNSDEPDWLDHVNANVLKIKLGMAIIGISSIHLLATFIEVARMQNGVARDPHTDTFITWDGAMWQVVIHFAFILSALALAAIDRLQISGDIAAKLARLDRGHKADSNDLGSNQT